MTLFRREYPTNLGPGRFVIQYDATRGPFVEFFRIEREGGLKMPAGPTLEEIDFTINALRDLKAAV